jgi:hypothetical protein
VFEWWGSDRRSRGGLDLVTGTVAEAGAAGSGDRIARLLRARARLDAVVYTEVDAFDAAGGSTGEGAATAAGWLRAEQRLGRRDASGLVFQARQLRDLPVTSAALGAGTISREHATAILKAKVSTGLETRDFDPYEAILVELAEKASPDEVRAAAAHLVEAEAPDRDRQLVAALAGRRFDLVPVGDLVKVDAMIDKPTAETLLIAVEALSRRLPGDDRTWHQRRADAFSAIVQHGVEAGSLPQHGRVKPHISLVLTLDQLTGIDAAGPLLARFGRIPADSARRLACDAALTRIVTDPTGDVVDVGRASRHTTTAQNRALAAMYGVCGYPNCDIPLARCDIHHVTWWSRGGSTDLANLVPLCKSHHGFVHEAGYSITMGRDSDGQSLTRPDRWQFLTPDGRPIHDHRTTLKTYLDQRISTVSPRSPALTVPKLRPIHMPEIVPMLEMVPVPVPAPVPVPTPMPGESAPGLVAARSQGDGCPP